MRTEPKAKEHVIRYCLPDSSLLLSYNPETLSLVTLASLGIVFQTKPPDTVTHLSVIKESPSREWLGEGQIAIFDS